jgi:hypothetical protein
MNLTEGGRLESVDLASHAGYGSLSTHRKTSRFGLRIEYGLALVLRFPQKTLISLTERERR